MKKKLKHNFETFKTIAGSFVTRTLSTFVLYLYIVHNVAEISGIVSITCLNQFVTEKKITFIYL